MNIGKSIKIALAQREKNATWLAGTLDMHKQAVGRLMNNPTAQGATITRLAGAFLLKDSEFIALGE